MMKLGRKLTSAMFAKERARIAGLGVGSLEQFALINTANEINIQPNGVPFCYWHQKLSWPTSNKPCVQRGRMCGSGNVGKCFSWETFWRGSITKRHNLMVKLAIVKIVREVGMETHLRGDVSLFTMFIWDEFKAIKLIYII